MKRRAKILLPLGILGAGLLGVALIWLTRPAVESTRLEIPAPLVRVRRVDPRPVDFVVRAHGTVAPRTESDLIPQVSGPVVWVSPTLASGGFFEDGEPLIRIDRADYEVALESARAAVARSESEYERAHKELERQKRLAKQSVASASRYDDAVNAERIAAAVLREARAKLERAERDLERTEIRAPYAGRVREENVDAGQFVTRGTPIGRIYAVDYAEVRLPVPDAELSFMDLPLLYRDETPEDGGPPVLLRARFAGGEHTWTGHIVRTEGEIDARSRMVNVVARVKDPYGRGENSAREESDEPIAVSERKRPPLAVGLFVEAEIQGRRVEAAVILPRSALRDGDRVLVVDAGGRLRFRDVEVLRKEREEVVIGDGLTAGEDVVVSPLPAVVDGMEVNVARDEPDQAGLAGASTDAGAKRSAVAAARP
jgi:RND family efflux transporter MFP subunit